MLCDSPLGGSFVTMRLFLKIIFLFFVDVLSTESFCKLQIFGKTPNKNFLICVGVLTRVTLKTLVQIHTGIPGSTL